MPERRAVLHLFLNFVCVILFSPRLRTCSKCNKQGGGEQARSQSDNFKCQQLRQATLPSFGKRKERVWRILMRRIFRGDQEEGERGSLGKEKNISCLKISWRSSVLRNNCHLSFTKPLYGESCKACKMLESVLFVSRGRLW